MPSQFVAPIDAPDSAALDRAERARVNGARSRGPTLTTASATAPPGSFERVWGLTRPEATPAGRGGSLG